MALTDAAVVVSKEPDNTKAWIRLGKALRSLGKADEAIKGESIELATTYTLLTCAFSLHCWSNRISLLGRDL